MQAFSPPSHEVFNAIEDALHPGRIDRYMAAAKQDRELAMRLYLWNCSLSEAFYLVLHVAEISCRNGIHKMLIARCGEEWFKHNTFLGLLDRRNLGDLNTAIAKEQDQHGNNLSPHHIVSALTFGFWDHLTTKRFERFLWAKGIKSGFPNAPKGMTFVDLHDLIESVRRWRNRIAHHRAIFDRSLTRKLQDSTDLIDWHCGNTSQWVKQNIRIHQIQQMRPK